ncbi:MAG: hypothetical protein OXR66_02220 [Candidatus Woesearchaeota archaeon]|nr:hypothetical protein [Candidatus Woesearchaeota archaeon]
MPKNNTRFKIFSYNCRGFGDGVRALRAACAAAVDGMVFDCRLTKDGKWVVPLQDTQLLAHRIHTRVFTALQQEVLALDAVLALTSALAPNKQVMLTMKDVGEERALARLAHDCVIVAWDTQFLERFHAISPATRLGIAYAPMRTALPDVHKTSQKGMRLQYDPMERFDAGLHFGKVQHEYLLDMPNIPIHTAFVHGLFCSSKLVERAHAKGVQLIAFLVDTKLSAGLLRRRGVDGIVTATPQAFQQ